MTLLSLLITLPGPKILTLSTKTTLYLPELSEQCDSVRAAEVPRYDGRGRPRSLRWPQLHPDQL